MTKKKMKTPEVRHQDEIFINKLTELEKRINVLEKRPIAIPIYPTCPWYPIYPVEPGYPYPWTPYYPTRPTVTWIWRYDTGTANDGSSSTVAISN